MNKNNAHTKLQYSISNVPSRTETKEPQEACLRNTQNKMWHSVHQQSTYDKINNQFVHFGFSIFSLRVVNLTCGIKKAKQSAPSMISFSQLLSTIDT